MPVVLTRVPQKIAYILEQIEICIKYLQIVRQTFYNLFLLTISSFNWSRQKEYVRRYF